MIYSVDASSLIETYEKKYPPAVFPSVWERIESLVADGRIKVSEVIVDELGSRSDGVHEWVERHPEMVVPMDEAQQLAVREILDRFPTLIEPMRNKSGGDPFVIALAKVHSGVVVTEESPMKRRDRPNVPATCREFQIACDSFLGFLKREKWLF